MKAALHKVPTAPIMFLEHLNQDSLILRQGSFMPGLVIAGQYCLESRLLLCDV